MKRYTYNHGLPFNKKLAENIDYEIKRVELKKASMIIVDGIVGEGKTTLAIHIADYINHKHGMKNVSLEKSNHPQLAMGGKEFQKNLRICYKEGFVVLIYDEAGDFNKRGSLTRFNEALNRTFETFRAFKVIIIMCLPSFEVLDNSLFDKGIPRLLLHCFDRNENYGNFAGYSLYLIFYLKKVMARETVKLMAYRKVYPNFYGQFLDIEPARSKKLDILSTTSKLEISKMAEIKMEGLLSYDDVSKKTLRSIIWVKKAVQNLKIKHSRIIDRKKYFKSNVVDILLDYIDKKGVK